MEKTTSAIMEAFEQLLDEKPFTKITVRDIVERCQINRNTFYYHYHDIPSLFQEMMERKADQLIAIHYVPNSPINCLQPILQYGLAHKRAALHVYRYVPREALMPYIDRIARYAVDKYFEGKCRGLSVSEADVASLAHYYKCALVGLLLDWAESGMEEDVIERLEPIYRLLEGTEEMAFSRCLRGERE